MKTASLVLRSALAVCFAFVMSSASCDLFDKVDDVTIEVELSHTFHVDETNDDENVVYGLKEVLDAASVNSEFDKYKDKITAITVTSVTYQVQNCSIAGVIFTNGSVGYSSLVGSAPSQIATLGAENIKAVENQTKNLNFNQVALNELSTLLKNDKKVNLYMTGVLSETPAKFDVFVVLKASITADAL